MNETTTIAPSAEPIATEEHGSRPVHRRKRPFGLRAIMVLLALSAFGDMLDFITLLAKTKQPHQIFLTIKGPAQSLDATITIILLATVALDVAIIIGLWRLKRWAWVLVMLLLGYSMAVSLWNYFNGHADYTSMLLDVIMVFYLNQGEVQRVFGPGRRWRSST